MRARASVTAGVLAACLGGPAVAPAAAAGERARLAYVSGGTIYSIDADGADRRRIIRGLLPSYSPSGDAIAFTRYQGGQIAVWLARPDGSDARRVATNSYGAAWSPDGQHLAVTRFDVRARSPGTGIDVVRRDGGDRRVVVPRPSSRRSLVALPVWAPSGERLLYTRMRGGEGTTRPPHVRSVAVNGDDDRPFLSRASGGAFSPDGTRLAFTDHSRFTQRDGLSSDLGVASADGTSRQVLARSAAVDDEPAWSPDGSRIAFVSDRNLPSGGHTHRGGEIYTIAPDGSCLTWLTNGTPASASPAWEPGSGAAAPAACGDAERQPSLGFQPPARAAGSWWLGPQLGRALLSDTHGRGPSTEYMYGDCSSFDPRECPPSLWLSQFDTCRSGRAARDVLFRMRGLRRARGGAIVGFARAWKSWEVFTGRASLSLSIDPDDRSRRRATIKQALAALRPFGRAVPATLPAPVLPAGARGDLPRRLRAGVKTCPAR
jgi:hypothetical protein